MKRTLFAIAFALVSSIAFISGVMAQQSTTTPPATQSAPSAPARMVKFSGTVEKVDDAAKEFVVKKGNDEKTFSWSDRTKFMQGKKELTSSDVKKGEHVSVRYKMEGSKLTAEKVFFSMKKTSQKKSM